MHFEPIPFVLPAHSGLVKIETFAGLRQRVESIGQGSGKSGEWFKRRCEKFERLSSEGLEISEILEARRDIRVVLQLWLTNKKWRFNCPPDRKALTEIFALSEELRPTHVYDLIQLYFLHFDELPDVAMIAALLRSSLMKLPEQRWLTDVRKLRENAKLIFSENAPKKVAIAIVNTEQGFTEGLEKLGVSASKTGAFMEACRRAYFIETVRNLKPGENHAIFKELVKPETKESPYSQGQNVGQAVCAILIQKCVNLPKGMPQAWLQLVLRIVGDPRRPKRSSGYQKWWAGMEPAHEKHMRRWLAGLDLHLFLKILEDCSTDEDLTRMYPARKAFLEGLLDNYGVEDARLFLGQEAANFIRREFGRDSLLAHGLLSGRNKSVIYIRVNGHDFFEGTHNYAARLGVGLPVSHPIVTRAKSRFQLSEVSTDLDYDMEGSTNKGGEYYYVRHWPPLGWQKQLIDGFNDLGLRIKPQDVLTRADYLTYRRKYGI